ncbi:phosphoglycerate mutase family protein [Candidatus Falkowbacteria bacterium]|nr:phosphoglycerate mutase family protein [Candidatus Falkowbacteria bacterium]
MAMPNDLVLVRHGESEGNVIKHAQEQDKKIKIPAAYYERHSTDWRLTKLGVKQAKMAGKWLRENVDMQFDRYYTSSYNRAKETAAHLQLPNAHWFPTPYLGERNWGILDQYPVEVRIKKFQADFKSKEINAFYWAPPRGESMVQICMRVDRVLDTLHRECDGKRVIIVCHGEIMWAFRIRIERMTVEQFLGLDQSENPFDRINNCQIIHYTRKDPQSKKVTSHMDWMKSVCPTNLSLSRNEWVKVTRHSFTNEDLLQEAEKIKRLIN